MQPGYWPGIASMGRKSHTTGKLLERHQVQILPAHK